MLQAENLGVWRGFNCLFQELCWAVPEGSALLVRGPNGAGKTTLLRIIVGLSDAESGRLLWHGAPLPETRPCGGAWFAWQGHLPGLKRELTAAQNLHCAARLVGYASAGIGQVAARLGLADRLDLEVRQLSAGQQRRLALARLLMTRAPIWVLDEPFTNLDTAGRELLESLLSAHLAQGGIAIIAAHHELGAKVGPVVRLQLGEQP